MADIKSTEERSRNMAAIRSKDTKPEVYLRKLLFSKGFRYRKNVSYIPGHPDMWLKKYNTAIFVNGCFWHRHKGCKYAYFPKSREEFWQEKFKKNIQRDEKVKMELNTSGVRCLVVWECTVHRIKKENEDQTIKQICCFLRSDSMYMEV